MVWLRSFTNLDVTNLGGKATLRNNTHTHTHTEANQAFLVVVTTKNAWFAKRKLKLKKRGKLKLWEKKEKSLSTRFTITIKQQAKYLYDEPFKCGR